MPYPGSSTYPGSTTYPGTDGPVTTTSSLRLGIGRSFVRTAGTGGGGVTPGPTVQLAGVTSPLSLVHGTTGTFTATPEDINAVSTGQGKYWHSSDAAVVRIDDATTGAYTVTGVATNTVTITVNFVAPAAPALSEPIFTGTGGQTSVYSSTLSEYAGMTVSDMALAYGGTIQAGTGYAFASNTGPVRFSPNRTDDYCQLVHRPDGTGVALHMRSTEPPDQVSYTYGNFQLEPGALGTNGPVPDRAAHHFMQFHWKWDAEESKPFSTPYRDKGVEFWHQDVDAFRIQIAKGDDAPPHLTRYGWVDASFHYNPTDGYSGDRQFTGPWVNEDMMNSGTGWRHTVEIKPLSLSPGTVDILLQRGDYYFENDIAVTNGVVNGNRIKIPNSTAEFVISAITPTVNWGGVNRTHAHIERQSDLTGNVGTFAFHFEGRDNVEQKAVFSASRAGVLTSGAHGGYLTLYGDQPNNRWFEVANFDGDKGCDLIYPYPSSFSNSGNIGEDRLGQHFNDTQDSIHRLWIAPDGAAAGVGTLVVDLSLTGVANGHCTRAGIATMAVNDGIYRWILFGASTQGGNMTADFYGTDTLPIRWWTV